jgi:periplasmic divalent cation tolerance protein
MIYTTFGDSRSAEQASRALVSERLAACTNSFPIDSVYRWRGQVHRAAEVGVLVKTASSLLPRAVSRLRELHPYENPCAVEIALGRGRAAYFDWISESTAPLGTRRRRPRKAR